jgi:hypothetical protein
MTPNERRQPVNTATPSTYRCTNDCYSANTNAREAEIAASGGDWLTYRSGLQPQQSYTDRVYFTYDSTFPASQYRVMVQALSVQHSGDSWHDIGALSRQVELPNTIFSKGFGQTSKITVIPTNASLPGFVADLHRGFTYAINPNAPIVTAQGHRSMKGVGSR